LRFGLRCLRREHRLAAQQRGGANEQQQARQEITRKLLPPGSGTYDALFAAPWKRGTPAICRGMMRARARQVHPRRPLHDETGAAAPLRCCYDRRATKHKKFAALPALLLSLACFAQDDPYAPDTPEPGSVEAIAEFTTDSRYLSPWVAYVPESDTVPSPADYLGRVVGTPGELTRTEQIYGDRKSVV